MKYSIPTVDELREIIGTETTALQYLVNQRIIEKNKECPRCSSKMNIILERKIHRCTRYDCRSERSCVAGTFFAGERIKINKIIEIAYYWLSRASNAQIETYTGISNKTVAALIGFLRGLVADALDELDYVIGGDGVIVEIDETKLGKRKYNRGHRVEGVWVLVGVERTAERKVFLRIIEKRDSETLTSMILQHVHPKSVIVTDYWKGYSGLSEQDFTHLRVNHSITFKDEMTGACTNTVEGTNNAIKMSIPPRQRTKDCENNLWEFAWRRRNKERLWDALIDAFREIVFE